LVLTGADGIVFVADSQRARLDANLESLANLNDNLREQGRELQSVPHVIAYNKRDLYDIVSIEELERALDKHGAPSFATCATTGDGVYETLDAIARAVMDDFERKNPEARELVQQELKVPEAGLTEALRGIDSTAPASVAGGSLAVRRPSGLLSLNEPFSPAPAAKQEAATRAEASSPAPMPSEATAAPGARASEAPSEPLDGAHRVLSPPIEARGDHEPSLDEPSLPAEGVSFQALWPNQERVQVLELEQHLRRGQFAEAIRLADELVSRTLAGVAGALGSAGESPRDPALVVLLLGLDGRRYLEF